jgi:hypothetical protein
MSPHAQPEKNPAVEAATHLSEAAGVAATAPIIIADHKDASEKQPEATWAEDASSESRTECPYTDQEIKRTMRRIDIVVVPVLTVLLAFCFIDRANMGLAAVAGMVEELGLVGFQYSTTLLLFFPGYVLFALPSNYFLSKVSVRVWLCALGLGFGLFTLLMGVIQNFAGLAVMRLLLGFCEAG